MAAEAIQRKYKYLSLEAAKSKSAQREFFHNAGHDMESVFWVIFFILVNVESKEDSVRKLIDDLLFTGSESSADPRWFFVSSYSEAIVNYRKLFGNDREDLLDKLVQLGVILTRRYMEAEANYPEGPIDDSIFLGIHEEFCSIWLACETYLAAQDIRLNTGPEAKVARTSVKRPAESEFTRSLRSKRTRTCVFYLQFNWAPLN